MNSEADILKAVLEQDIAFSPPSLRQSALVQEDSNDPHESPNLPDEPSSEATTSSDDGWKAQYDSQVEAWRAQSSEARLKAERERQRWESIRASEKQHKTPSDDPEWETIGPKLPAVAQSVSIFPDSSSSQDAEKHALQTPKTDGETSHSRQDTGDDSQKWEDVPSSPTSSFPSMTFPENIESSQEAPVIHTSGHSVTLSIFDSSLSTGTRVKALLSSLTINLLLPFVNGVMLGFGEIFAKNVLLGWLGWNSAPAVASVGLKRRS